MKLGRNPRAIPGPTEILVQLREPGSQSVDVRRRLRRSRDLERSLPGARVAVDVAPDAPSEPRMSESSVWTSASSHVAVENGALPRRDEIPHPADRPAGHARPPPSRSGELPWRSTATARPQAARPSASTASASGFSSRLRYPSLDPPLTTPTLHPPLLYCRTASVGTHRAEFFVPGCAADTCTPSP